jgi:hypothetical protein
MKKQMSLSLVELLEWGRRTRRPITIIGTDLPKPVIPGKKEPETIIVPLTARDESDTTFDECIEAIQRRYRVELFKSSAEWKICVDGEMREHLEVTLKVGDAYN